MAGTPLPPLSRQSASATNNGAVINLGDCCLPFHCIRLWQCVRPGWIPSPSSCFIARGWPEACPGLSVPPLGVGDTWRPVVGSHHRYVFLPDTLYYPDPDTMAAEYKLLHHLHCIIAHYFLGNLKAACVAFHPVCRGWWSFFQLQWGSRVQSRLLSLIKSILLYIHRFLSKFSQDLIMNSVKEHNICIIQSMIGTI